MYTDPKKNRTQVDHILLEQFRRKGYKCEEVLQHDATVFIIRHEKKTTDSVTQVVSESYKSFLKIN